MPTRPQRPPLSILKQRPFRSRCTGGCSFAESPDRSFETARLIWSAAIDPGVLIVTAGDGEDATFDLARLPHHVVVDAQGGEHVAILAPAGLLRLDVLAGTLLAGPIALRVHLDCTQHIVPRLVALDRLLRLLAVHDPGRRQPAPDRRLDRLAESLSVIDALAGGASLQEVAARLYGDVRRPADWPGDGEHLKSRIRRRVALARRLLHAGPRGILNHLV